MVILLYKEQAQLFKKAKIRSFEIDMNFKHVAEAEHNEVILAYFDHQLQRCKSSPSNYWLFVEQSLNNHLLF